MRLANHVDFQVVGHASLFEVSTELSVDESDSREVLHACKAQVFQLLEEGGHGAERVGSADAGNDWSVFDDWQDFLGLKNVSEWLDHFEVIEPYHVNDDIVSIAIGHESCQRAPSRHAKATAVVDDDEVTAAGLDEFGREANSSSGAYNGLALRDLFSELGEDLFAVCWGRHGV